MSNQCWLPELIYFEDSDSDWVRYEKKLYDLFTQDFIVSQPMFRNKKVAYKKWPMENEKVEAFYHITCKNYTRVNNRQPDFRRCERIKWVRSFIENYQCDPAQCIDCDGIKVWYEPYKAKTRVHLLLEEERYLVVLELRGNYYLLITAFYIEHDHSLEKKLKKYFEYRENNST